MRALVLVLGFVILAGCGPKRSPSKAPAVVPAPVPSTVTPVASFSAASAPPPAPRHRAAERSDLAAQQAAHPTRLLDPGPSPQPGGRGSPRDGVVEVTYPSAGRQLRGWLRKGSAPQSPVLVYLHGGFGADPEEVFACMPFVDAGYTIFVPTYRGENGNPGPFEMFFGEVADAAAAVRWVAARPDIDPSRVHVFGHSAGAAVSALLAAYPDVPARMTGGAGGFYSWRDVRAIALDVGMPFDPGDEHEVELRSPVAQIEAIRRPHHAFAGLTDPGARYGQRLAWVATAGKEDHPLQLYRVPGDHFASLPIACQGFFALAEGKALPPSVQRYDRGELASVVLDEGFSWRSEDDLLGQGPFDAEPTSAAAPRGTVASVGGFEARFIRGPLRSRRREGQVSMEMLVDTSGPRLLSLTHIPIPYPAGASKMALLDPLENMLFRRGFEAVRWFEHAGDPAMEAIQSRGGKRIYVRAVSTKGGVVMLLVSPFDDELGREAVQSFRPAAAK